MVSDWTSTTLGEVAAKTGGSIKTGPFGTALKAAEYAKDGVPVISTGEIRRGFIQLLGRTPRVSAVTVARLSEYVLREGDLVFTRKGAIIDRSARINGAQAGWFLGSDGLRVRLGPGVDSEFLAYQCQSLDTRDWINQHAGGTTMPSLNQAIIGRLPIRLPSLEEQRRIASVLGALDDLIETDRAQVAVLEQRARLAAATADVAVVLAEIALPVGVKQVRPSGLVEHYSLPAFDDGAEPERVEGKTIQSNKLPITQPSVLVSRLNPKWERCWMAYPGANAVASTEFVPLVGNEAESEEVWAVTSAPAFWEQMRTQVTGTTGSHQRVDKGAVLGLTVPDVRSLAVADRRLIVTLVQGAHALRDEIAGLTRTRDELLPLLMSGRVRVSEDLELA